MRPLPQLDRFVMREVAGPAALGFVTYTFLLMMRGIFGLMEQVFVRGVAAGDAVELLGATVPQVVVLTIPMSYLFGVLLAMGRMNAENEIIAFHAAGLSTVRLLRPVVVLSLVMFGLSAFLTLEVIPGTARHLRELKTRIFASAKSLGRIEPRVFHEGFPNLLLYVKDVDTPSGYWRDVLLHDRSVPGEERLTVARRGRLVTDVEREAGLGGRELEDAESGEPWLLLEDATTYDFDPRNPATLRVNDNQRQLHKLFPKTRGTSSYRPGAREQETLELIEIVRSGGASLGAGDGGRGEEQRASQLRAAGLELHKRLAIPCACAVFALLAVPLGVGSRSGGRGRGFILSISVVLVYYVAFNHGELLAMEGRVPVWFGVWLPNIALTLLALLLMRRMGRWLGERYGGERWYLRMWRRFKEWRTGRRLQSLQDHRGGAPLTGSLPISVQRRRYAIRFPALLDRYVMRRLLAPLTIVVASTAALYIVVDLTDHVDEIGRNDAPLDVVLAYYWNLIPQVVLDVTPLGLLISVLVLLSVLERRKELTALKAAGLSLYRLMVPVLLIAGAASVGLWLLEESVVPASNREATRLLDTIKGRERTRSYQATDRQWLLSRDGTALYNFLRYDVDSQTVIRFTLYRFSESMELRFHLFAEEVRYVNGSWMASKGWFREIFPDGGDRFKEIAGSVDAGIPESPGYFGQEYRQPGEMSQGQLRTYIAELEDSGYRPVKLVVRWHQKLAYPLTACIMVFLALPFGLNLGGRRVSVMQGVAIALGLGIGYYLLNMGLSKMGEAGLLPPVVGGWAPTVLAMLFAVNRLTTLRT